DEGGDTEEASDPDAAVLSEVAGLFDRLRTDGADVDETVEPTSGREPAPDRTDAAHSDGPMRIVDLEVFELRDRVLLPVTNQGLRSVKRRLMDHQNSALEELRIDADGWAPPEDVIGDDLRPELEAIAHDSLAAGHEAAEALVGVELPPLETTPTIPVDAFVGPLVAALNQTLTDGRESGEGDRQLSAAVSRVFRVWRTDQAERRVRRLSLEWYHRGLVAGMGAAGHENLSWRVAGRGCATCREHGSERAATAIPPAHADCECTLAPLVAVR
ncbi:MAG: hypothetical protein R3246_14635, partial [Acidimicrobiia bacterium]|nr:hypothetical protein [Acidimicrobiia bacterium]